MTNGFEISDGNANERAIDWVSAIEVAENWYENWYEYLSWDDDFDQDNTMLLIADYSTVPENDTEALNNSIGKFENELAEKLGNEAFHGHGAYSMNAASQAGFNLKVKRTED